MLQWSRDLVHWTPVGNFSDRSSEFIPLSGAGFDSHMCYTSASPVTMPDGSVRLYYAASDGPHDGNNRSTSIGLATLKSADRWAGLRARTCW